MAFGASRLRSRTGQRNIRATGQRNRDGPRSRFLSLTYASGTRLPAPRSETLRVRYWTAPGQPHRRKHGNLRREVERWKSGRRKSHTCHQRGFFFQAGVKPACGANFGKRTRKPSITSSSFLCHCLCAVGFTESCASIQFNMRATKATDLGDTADFFQFFPSGTCGAMLSVLSQVVRVTQGALGLFRVADGKPAIL